ncbi:hypothetical protein [Kitasatospora sp. NPDC001175]|uniref:hypothetical protein n=2 Tax=Kitasatospora TaxID=2063 RepID=UPI003CFC691F
MLIDRPDEDPPTTGERPVLRQGFWAAYLMRTCRTEDGERRLVAEWFGADVADADAAWEAGMADGIEFRVPFGNGHSVVVANSEYPTDWGTEWYVSHPDWHRGARLAYIDHVRAVPERGQGPGLSWRELTHIANTPDLAAPGVHDPRSRLLLLLPALGDDDLPAGAAGVIGSALVSVGAPAADAPRLAAFVLQNLMWEAAGWALPRGTSVRWWRVRPFAGILQCDAQRSPRFGGPFAPGITHEQSERLAHALGTWPAARGRGRPHTPASERTPGHRRKPGDTVAPGPQAEAAREQSPRSHRESPGE